MRNTRLPSRLAVSVLACGSVMLSAVQPVDGTARAIELSAVSQVQATPTPTGLSTSGGTVPGAAGAAGSPFTGESPSGAAVPAPVGPAVVAPAAQGTPTTPGATTPAQVLVTITPTPQPVVLASTCTNSAASALGAPSMLAAPLPFPGLPLPGPLLGAPPILPFPGLPLPGLLPPILAPPLAPAPPAAATNNAPLLSCVNTSVGVALQWTPLRGTPGSVTYGVYRCDRTAVPGQPGCESIFTTDTPALFGPVSLGADYIVQATSGNLIVVSNRVPL